MATTNLTVSQWITLSLMIPTLLIGFLGNLLVLVIVAKKKRSQTPHDVFIFNLAVADFLFVNLTILPNIVGFFGLVSRYGFYCHCVFPTITATFLASIFHITSMAIQRCRVITNPWRSKMKRRTAIIWAVINWLCALIITLPLIIVVRPTIKCFEEWPTAKHRKAYTAALVTLQYVLPLLVTAGCYVKMGLYLWRSRVQRTEVNVVGEIVQRDNRSQNKEIIKTLSVIVITFTVTMLPLQISWLLLDFGNFKGQAWLNTLFGLSNALAMLHSSLNPIIYGTVSKRFRREYVLYLTHLCKCCNRDRRVFCHRSRSVKDKQDSKECEQHDRRVEARQFRSRGDLPPVILGFQ